MSREHINERRITKFAELFHSDSSNDEEKDGSSNKSSESRSFDVESDFTGNTFYNKCPEEGSSRFGSISFLNKSHFQCVRQSVSLEDGYSTDWDTVFTGESFTPTDNTIMLNML